MLRNATKRVDWSPKKRVTAITLKAEGYSYRRIAEKLGGGVSASAVRKVWNWFQMTGKVNNKKERGRKRTTTPTTDRRIARLALGDRKLTARNINNILSDTGISIKVFRRRLVHAGLNARRPRKKPF